MKSTRKTIALSFIFVVIANFNIKATSPLPPFVDDSSIFVATTREVGELCQICEQKISTGTECFFLVPDKKPENLLVHKDCLRTKGNNPTPDGFIDAIDFRDSLRESPQEPLLGAW